MNAKEMNKVAGVIQPKVLAAMVCLLVLGGGVALLIHRQSPRAQQIAVTAPAELSRTNLLLEAGRLRQLGSATPFSGTMVEHYPDGVLRSRSAVVDGLLHGVSEGWYTNAQLQVAEHFQRGVSHGLRTKWYPDGAKQSEAQIADGKLNGTFRRWHENGALSEQAEFVAGQPEGISLAYFQSGSLKARVIMKAGQSIEQQFWKDGQRGPSSPPASSDSGHRSRPASSAK